MCQSVALSLPRPIPADIVLAQATASQELFPAMKTIPYRLRCALLAAAFAFLGSTVFAADSELGQAAGSVPIPTGVSRAATQAAIEQTLLGRQWDVTSKTDGQVVGHIKHRSNEATLTLIYSDTKVDLFCVGWQIDKKTGTREKPEQPTGWLKYIRSDLAKKLSRAAEVK
jgi:hypothetical protein